MQNEPTPAGTPTQIYIRFEEETADGIHCLIGCDGEDRAPYNTRMTMAAILQGIALTMALFGDPRAGESANRIADAILKRSEVEEAKE